MNEDKWHIFWTNLKEDLLEPLGGLALLVIDFLVQMAAFAVVFAGAGALCALAWFLQGFAACAAMAVTLAIVGWRFLAIMRCNQVSRGQQAMARQEFIDEADQRQGMSPVLKFTATVCRLVHEGKARYHGLFRRRYVAIGDAHLQRLLDRGAKAEACHDAARKAADLHAGDERHERFQAAVEELGRTNDELLAVIANIGELYPREAIAEPASDTEAQESES